MQAIPLSNQLRDVMRCPLTASAMTEQGNTVQSANKYNGRSVHYHVVDGIPVLIAEFAEYSDT